MNKTEENKTPTRYQIERCCKLSFAPVNTKVFVFCCADEHYFGETNNKGADRYFRCCEQNCRKIKSSNQTFETMSEFCRKMYCNDGGARHCKFGRSEGDSISFHQRQIGLKEWPEVADLALCSESRCPILNMTDAELDEFRMDWHRMHSNPEFKEKN